MQELLVLTQSPRVGRATCVMVASCLFLCIVLQLVMMHRCCTHPTHLPWTDFRNSDSSVYSLDPCTVFVRGVSDDSGRLRATMLQSLDHSANVVATSLLDLGLQPWFTLKCN